MNIDGSNDKLVQNRDRSCWRAQAGHRPTRSCRTDLAPWRQVAASFISSSDVLTGLVGAPDDGVRPVQGAPVHFSGELMKTSASTLIVSLAVSSALAASGAAIAASPKLKGTYAETGENSCLISTTKQLQGNPPVLVDVVPSGFNPDTLTPNQLVLSNGAVVRAFSFLFLTSFHGVRTFDGEGSGTLRGRNVGVTSSPNIPSNNFIPNATATDIVGDFTYEVAPDGTISTEHATDGTVISGPRAGQTVTNAFALTGRASNNRHSLILATDAQRIETVRFSNGEVQERLCNRSRTLIRIDD